MMRAGSVVLAAACLAMCGCRAKAPEGAAAARQPVSGPTGEVTGTVVLTGKAPAPVTIDTSMDPACAMAGGGDVKTEQYVVQDGRLANVFVYVKSGPAAAMNALPADTAPVVLDQKGCRYVPHVVGVMAGQELEFRNSDPTLHNVHTMPAMVGNEPVDESEQPHGAPIVKRMDKPELMLPVRCNNHPWMNAFVNVSATPFFMVTGADGRFTLKGLPPGHYTLGAVQEKLGEQTVDVTVAANAAAETKFTFAMK